MNTYLLTWNPAHYSEEDFEDGQMEAETSGFSIANNRKIAKRGDRILLVRTGNDGNRGVVAAGYVLGPAKDYGEGQWRYQIPIKWVAIQTTPIITHPELYGREDWHWDNKGWSPQSGGRIIPPEVAQAVWAEIEKRKGKKMPVKLIEGVEPEEDIGAGDVDAADIYDVLESIQEGARTRVETNKAERNPRARERCLGKHGFTCTCCEMDFYSMYGAPVTLVHVHHLKPVGSRGKSEETKVKDLATVCPNCHAVIHSQDPPFTPKEVKQMWLDGGPEIETNKGDIVSFKVGKGRTAKIHTGKVTKVTEDGDITVKVGKETFEITVDMLVD